MSSSSSKVHPTIAVTGASGQLGRLTLDALRARAPGATVVALARSPDKLRAALEAQASAAGGAAKAACAVREADYDRAETLAPALRGVDTLALISSSSPGSRLPQHLAVIKAAKEAGVRRIVYTSLLKGDKSPLGLAPDHVATEAALRESGLTHTVLRNGWYLENQTASLPASVPHGQIIGAAGDGRFSAAARADYAEALAAVAGAADGEHDGKVYELAGDKAYTLADLAAAAARRSGKPVRFQNLAEADFAGALAGFGLPPAMAALVADADARAASGALFDDSRTLSRLIGRPTTTLEQAVAAALPAPAKPE